ncbi:MAG: hypothetical protein AAF628_07270 [Planctomycetota bacterium]
MPVGDKAGFRDFQWINVEVPTATWMAARRAPLSLLFVRKSGEAIALPPRESAFAAALVAR